MSQKLQKSLGLSAALSTVIGMVIGGGVFFKPSSGLHINRRSTRTWNISLGL